MLKEDDDNTVLKRAGFDGRYHDLHFCEICGLVMDGADMIDGVCWQCDDEIQQWGDVEDHPDMF